MAEGSDSVYCYPGTSVLRNLLDIRDPELLSSFEAQSSALRMSTLAGRKLPGRYDLAHLRGFHRRIFGDVYPWAGELRTVDISKGGTGFLPVKLLGTGAQWAFGELESDGFLRGLDQERFVARLAVHLGNVNELHPFREGNGRAQRAFFYQLAGEAGYRIGWERLDEGRNIEASRAASLNPRAVELRDLLAELVEPVRAPGKGKATAAAGEGRSAGKGSPASDSTDGTAVVDGQGLKS